VKARLIQVWDASWAACARVWRDLWRESPACLLPATAPLELPLRPSTRLRALRKLLGLLILTYVLELLLEGHWLAVSLVMLAAVAMHSDGRSRWRCLRLEMDGRLYLIGPDGTAEQAWLKACGLHLGPHLLLVLHSCSGTHRALLGPDNLAAGQLAALRRRLPGGTAGAVTALHSVAAPGSKSTTPPPGKPMHLRYSPPIPPRGELFTPPGVHAGDAGQSRDGEAR
jgi:hypothetical protein